jgi:hypothetical protein
MNFEEEEIFSVEFFLWFVEANTGISRGSPLFNDALIALREYTQSNPSFGAMYKETLAKFLTGRVVSVKRSGDL